MITKKEIVRKFNLGLEKCRELENKGEKGQIRTTKGQSVENLATDLITLAYSLILKKFVELNVKFKDTMTVKMLNVDCSNRLSSILIQNS